MSTGRAHGQLLGPLVVFAVGTLIGVALWRFLLRDGADGDDLVRQSARTSWRGGGR